MLIYIWSCVGQVLWHYSALLLLTFISMFCVLCWLGITSTFICLILIIFSIRSAIVHRTITTISISNTITAISRIKATIHTFISIVFIFIMSIFWRVCLDITISSSSRYLNIVIICTVTKVIVVIVIVWSESRCIRHIFVYLPVTCILYNSSSCLLFYCR